MTDSLVEEGWYAPARPGPTRAWLAGAIALAVPALAWVVAWLALWQPSGEVYAVRVAPDGRASARLVESNSSQRGQEVELTAEVRTARDTRFVVLGGTLPTADPDARLRVEVPPGVEDDHVATRIAPAASGSGMDVLVSMPQDGVPQLDDATPAGSMRELTAPLDGRVADNRRDQASLERLRDGWWWMVPLGLVLALVLPLLLWRRARRRFFSMRRPGAGKELDSTPPSSLDPVGAAVLVAGARPVDLGDAFAGHVLDLVERRHLPMRRTTDPVAGSVACIGLGRAEELDDVAMHALRDCAGEDGITVTLAEPPRAMRRAGDVAWLAWRDHVAARVRFERMVDRPDVRRHAIAALLLAAALAAAVVVAATTSYDGRRAVSLLLAALLLPATVVVAAWWRDARRWRIVSRDRRLERAQWLAWRDLIGTGAGPDLDRRSLPVVAAVRAATEGIRSHATADATALDAVTARTIDALRAIMSTGRART